MRYRSMPTSPIFALRHEIDRLFDDTFGATRGRRSWLPEADVRETAGDYVFELELPGVPPDQVEVTADNGVLTVRGEKRPLDRREGEDVRPHIVERSYGSFLRAFQLPQGVDDGAIAAEFAHGVLTVHVPKAQRPQPRKIQVRQAGESQRLGEGEVAAPPQPQRGDAEGDGTEGAGRASRREREGAGAR